MIYLVLGILVLPIVLLLSVILLGYIFKVSTGLDVPGAPVGMAIWFPVLAYLIVAAMGVWRSANNQETEFRAAGVKHPLAPILAKLLALFCSVAVLVLGLATGWPLIDEFGGETLPWVVRQLDLADDRERVDRAGENAGEDKIKTLNEYLQYLSGKDFGEAKHLIDCLSIKLEYITFAKEVVTKEQPLSEFRYYYQDDTLVLLISAGLGTATQQEMNEVVADVPHSLKMGSQNRGSIPDEYLYFGAKVRLFNHYEVWYMDKTAAFDLTNYPKCKNYME